MAAPRGARASLMRAMMVPDGPPPGWTDSNNSTVNNHPDRESYKETYAQLQSGIAQLSDWHERARLESELEKLTKPEQGGRRYWPQELNELRKVEFGWNTERIRENEEEKERKRKRKARASSLGLSAASGGARGLVSARTAQRYQI